MSEDQNQPGVPTQPDAPDQPTQELAIPGRPVQEILKDANDLKRKIEEAEAARKAHVRALHNEHGYVAQAHKNLSDSIEEAEKNLAYFEQARKNGLLKDEDLVKYEKLKDDLEGVKKTRDEARAKMIAIFDQPEVGDKIHEDALDDNEDFNIEIERKKFIDGLGAKVEEFLSEIDEIAEKQLELNGKQTAAYEAFIAARNIAVNMAPDMAPDDSFGRFDNSPKRLLAKYLDDRIGLDDLERQLGDGVESMKGVFRGKEKKTILGLTSSSEFMDAEEKKKNYKDAVEEYDKYAVTLGNSGSKLVELRKKWLEDIMKPYRDLQARSRKLVKPNTNDEKRANSQEKFKDDTTYTVHKTVNTFCDARYSEDRTTELVYNGSEYRKEKGTKEKAVNSLFSRISPFDGI